MLPFASLPTAFKSANDLPVSNLYLAVPSAFTLLPVISSDLTRSAAGATVTFTVSVTVPLVIVTVPVPLASPLILN